MMNEYIKNFIKFTYNKEIILDSGVFLLLLAGLKIEKIPNEKDIDKIIGYTIDEKTIIKLNKNKNGYSINDFRLLFIIIEHYEKILNTPNILAEISNLNKSKRRKNTPNTREILFNRLKEIVNINYLNENFVNIKDIILDGRFNEFGVSDVGILETVKDNKIGVITDDYRFFRYLKLNNIPCLNFKDYHIMDN